MSGGIEGFKVKAQEAFQKVKEKVQEKVGKLGGHKVYHVNEHGKFAERPIDIDKQTLKNTFAHLLKRVKQDPTNSALKSEYRELCNLYANVRQGGLVSESKQEIQAIAKQIAKAFKP